MLTLKVFDLTNVDMDMVFVATLLIVGLVQVGTLLMIGRGMVEFFWWVKLDPDDYVLPLLSALGDLIGTGILVAAFTILTQWGRMHAEDDGGGAVSPTDGNGLARRLVLGYS